MPLFPILSQQFIIKDSKHWATLFHVGCRRHLCKGSTVLDERNSLLSYDFARRLLAAEDRGGTDGGAEHVDLCMDSERSLRKAIFDDEHIISLALETAQRQLLEVGRIISNDSMQEGNTQSQRMHVIQLSPLLLRQFYFNLPSKRCATNSGHAQLFKGKKVALDRDSGVELALVALHGLQVAVLLLLIPSFACSFK